MLITAAAVIAACGKGEPPLAFKATDITGSPIGGDFAMADASGKMRRLSDFRGKVVVLFFGFIQCPDVCPTTMAEVDTALKALGRRADDVQVLFITVDPERDTPEVLAQYVPAFNPTFVGLRGSNEELANVANLFKIYYAKVSIPSGGYTMDHSTSKFVIDKQGRTRLLVSHHAGPAALAHDLAQLLK